jgi:hypothetical protein
MTNVLDKIKPSVKALRPLILIARASDQSEQVLGCSEGIRQSARRMSARLVALSGFCTRQLA